MTAKRMLLISIWLFLCFLRGPCICGAVDDDAKLKHLKSARQYIDKGAFDEAAIEYLNVLQIDPQDDSACHELGKVYLRLEKVGPALKYLSKAAEINPRNIDAQIDLGRIFLLGKQVVEAKKTIDRILQRVPDHIGAKKLLAGVHIQEHRIDLAVDLLNEVTAKAPEDIQAHLSLAQLYLVQGRLDQAERSCLHVIDLDPESETAYLTLHRVYEAKKDPKKSESILKRMVRATGNKTQSYLALAHFYESRGRQQAAEDAYRKAVASAPEAQVGPLLELGKFYARKKDYQNALCALRQAAEKKPSDLKLRAAVAQLHFDFGKSKEAESVVDEILSENAGHITANLLKSRLCLADQRFAQAEVHIDRAIGEAPSNAVARYYKALGLMQRGAGDAARAELLKSIELQPKLMEARLLLADFYLRRRQAGPAGEQIDFLVQSQPQDLRVLILLGNLKALEKDFHGAQAAYAKAVALRPDYPPAYAKLGFVQRLNGLEKEAVDSLKKAVELNPGQTDALGLLVGMMISKSQFSEALDFCEQQRPKTEKNTAGLAYLDLCQGNIHLARGEAKLAEAQFRQAIETDPSLLSAYLALTRLYLEQDRAADAIVQYERLLGQNPGYLPAYMTLGTLHDRMGKKEKAADYYAKALAVQNDFAPAANNLAWNLASRQVRIDEALALAQTAKEKMPSDPGVMDTLGWIYYLKGSYRYALSELEDSLSHMPDNPVVNYHVGMVYAKLGEMEKARQFVRKAIGIDPDFEGADDARRFLGQAK